jgi:hypothetical protein
MGSYSTIVEKLVERMQFHTGDTGTLLQGVKFSDVPVLEVDGEADLPIVRLYIPDIVETFVPGALCKAMLVLRMTIATKRSDGIASHITKVEKVIDALEVNALGVVDSKLEGSIRQPFSLKTSDATVTSISITTQLSITVTPRKTPQRGKRATL